MTGAAPTTPRKPIRVLALLPVLNEVDTIDRVVRGTFATGAVDRMLVIDDRSTDGTTERLLALQDEFPALDVVTRDERGLGTALLSGFRLALE